MRRMTIIRLIAAIVLATVALAPTGAGAQVDDRMLPLMPISGSWGLVDDRAVTAPEVGFPDGFDADLWMRRWTDGSDSILIAMAETPDFETTTSLFTTIRSERESSIVGTVREIGGSAIVAEPAGTFPSGIVFQRGLYAIAVWGTFGVDVDRLAGVAVAQADYIGEAMRSQAEAELAAGTPDDELTGTRQTIKSEANTPDDASATNEPSAGSEPEASSVRDGTAQAAESAAASTEDDVADESSAPNRPTGPAVLRSLIPFIAAFGVGAAAGRLTNLVMGRTVGNPWAVGVGAVSATWAIILARSVTDGFDLATFGAHTVVAGLLIVVGVNLSYRIRNPWTPHPVYVDVAAIEAHLAEHAAEGEVIRVAADPFAQ